MEKLVTEEERGGGDGAVEWENNNRRIFLNSIFFPLEEGYNISFRVIIYSLLLRKKKKTKSKIFCFIKKINK